MSTTLPKANGALAPPGYPEDFADLALDLELTSVCDAVCGFCPREFMPDKKSFMSMDLIERLADDIQNKPGFPITLCGIGESMLHPRIFDIVRILTEASAKLEITTNGGRMDTESFRKLADMGLEAVNFSLNATSPKTHQEVMKLRNYDKVVRNVEQVLELKNRSYPFTNVHVTFVVCNLNQHEVDEFVEFWRPRTPTGIWLHPLNNRNGLLSQNVTPFDDMSSVEKRYADDPQVRVDIFSETSADANVCKVARTMMFVSVEGEMRLCAMDYKRATSFGNLRNTRLNEMQSDKIARYSRGEMNTFCEGCDFCPETVRAVRTASGA